MAAQATAYDSHHGQTHQTIQGSSRSVDGCKQFELDTEVMITEVRQGIKLSLLHTPVLIFPELFLSFVKC